MWFELLGLVIKGFVWLWVFIIATLPNVFMGGLTLCVAATVLTYVVRAWKQREDSITSDP